MSHFFGHNVCQLWLPKILSRKKLYIFHSVDNSFEIFLRIPLGIYPERKYIYHSFETFFGTLPLEFGWNYQKFLKYYFKILHLFFEQFFEIYSLLRLRLMQLVETPSMCLTFTIDIRTMQMRLWLWSFPGVSLPPAVLNCWK